MTEFWLGFFIGWTAAGTIIGVAFIHALANGKIRFTE